MTVPIYSYKWSLILFYNNSFKLNRGIQILILSISIAAEFIGYVSPQGPISRSATVIIDLS